ncbi:MAG: hypothetical protein ACTSVB_03595 [Candidatus Heimdallarchaeaceae archaeon]
MSKSVNEEIEKKMDEIENAVVEQLIIDEEFHMEVEEILNILIEKINSDLSSIGVIGRVEKQGSFVRRTYLNEDDTYDLVLILKKDEKPNVPRILDQLVERLKNDRIQKQPIQITKIVGKMPYLRMIANGILVNLFVGFDISPEQSKMSIFDLIPLHTSYIITHMSSNEKKDVLLLKKFMKSIGVYRNEIGAIGFNGYLCELLILFYGSFRSAIKAIAKWKPRVLIDMKKNKQVIEDVDAQTIELLGGYYPLYVSDPLAPRNNVAADVSINQFNSVISAANVYLYAPSLSFFLYQPVTLPSFETLVQKIKMSGKTILVLSFYRRHQESEICWQQALNMKKAFTKELERNRYLIERIQPFITDEYYGIFISLFKSKPQVTVRREGPSIFDGKASANFLKTFSTHVDVVSGPYIENQKWVIYFANRGQDVILFLQSLVHSNTFILEVDSFLKLEIKNKLKIHSVETTLKDLYNTDIEFAEQFYLFVERKPLWILNIGKQ